MTTDEITEKAPGMRTAPIDWTKLIAWVVIVLSCLAFWAGVGVGIAKADPGQELADDTAEWIGQTMKVPPLYRTVLRADGGLHIEGVGAELAGVVWCETPRETTLHPEIYAGWARMAVNGFISDRDYSAAMVVIHELAHREPETCIFDRYLAEGITQAITLDLFPAWCRRFFGLCASIKSDTYAEEVGYIRHQSAIATGGSWRARGARLWRRAFYLSDRDTRRAMIPTRGEAR